MDPNRLEPPPVEDPITPKSGPMTSDNPRLARWLGLIQSFVNRRAASVGQDIGNANVTLTVGSSSKTQIANTPLSVPREIILSTAGAFNGDEFHIIRTAAATGASGLDVGGLKTLAVGQKCIVTMTDTGWMLTDFGNL